MDTTGGLLQVEALAKRFGGLHVVDGVDLNIAAGEVVGLIGPNGAGKTTLFDCISGALRPDDGRVTFAGTDVTRESAASICRRGMARTYQHARIFEELSVAQNVEVALAFGRGPAASPARSVRELLGLVGLEGDPRRDAGTLPLGERKRLQVARALATSPKLLLLDEVVAGLDRAAATAMLDLVRRVQAEGTAVLLVEHVVHVVMNLSDRVVVLNHGRKIADGRPEDVRCDPGVADAYLGEELALS